MKIELKVVYRDGELGNFEESKVTLEVSDEKTLSIVDDIKRDATHQNLLEFFKHLYDYPDGVCYETLNGIFCHYGHDVLEWSDVMVDVVGLKTDGKKIPFNDNYAFCEAWSLQLLRDKSMYIYG